ncbi:hypothetical protein MTO96_002781 [Rhipicephalus appendiculatus]
MQRRRLADVGPCVRQAQLAGDPEPVRGALGHAAETPEKTRLGPPYRVLRAGWPADRRASITRVAACAHSVLTPTSRRGSSTPRLAVRVYKARALYR